MDHHHHNHHHHHHNHNHHTDHHSHHPNHSSHHPQQPSHAMYPPNTSPYTAPHMISLPTYTPNSNPNPNPVRFPFSSSLAPTPPSPPPNPNPTQDLDPLISHYSGSGTYEFDPNSQKKKRGRPRKYSPDNNGNNGGAGGGGSGSGIALGLSPTPISSSGGGGDGGGGGCQADSPGVTPSNDHSSKKNRGRPPSSSKKQLDALGNCGVGFTPHVILVNAGEDIASKIMDFSKQGERTVCVLSANGSVSNVDLRQPAVSGGVVQYEGRFEIISLSGSFLVSDNSGAQVRTGGLTVSLANADGRVLGGGVVGVLRAASHVQIIVGSFIANGKKPKYMPSVPQSHMLNFSGPPLPAGDNSPPSQDISTEGSDEHGSTHLDRNTGSYDDSSHPMHHNMQMYSQMNWSNPNSKMRQH